MAGRIARHIVLAMIEIFYTPEFEKRYRELPPSVQKKAERQEKLFRVNPYHSSLHTEKLQPAGKAYWSFRIDKVYRILFRFRDPQTVVLLTCGHHNWIYRFVLNR